MFYSYKNFPISIESFNKFGTLSPTYNSYNFIAQNLSLDINPNADFAYFIDRKIPSTGINSEGLNAVIGISFLSQTPNDYIFLNNILITGGEKNNFKIKCGNTTYTSGYLRSYNISADPNGLIQSQAEFIFYSTPSTNSFYGEGVSTYDIWPEKQNYYSHGSTTTISFSDSFNEFSNHDVRKIDFSYKADIQPIYCLENIYPSRVAFNKEQIDLFVELDTYDTSIRNINNIINTTTIVYGTFSNQNVNTSIALSSGYLVGKNFSIRTNDIINSRISLKYHI